MNEEKFRFISFGGGVQTTALLLMALDGKIGHVDEVIFADTGGEWPETYSHIELMERACERASLPFTTVKSPLESLEEWCIDNKKTPARAFRWCTDKWKIRPIRKYLKDRGRAPAVALMGISLDEVQRVHDPHWSEYSFEYPLIDRRLTRSHCISIISGYGMKVPHKSGCFYCPFQGNRMFRELYFNHRDLFDRARKLEENNPRFPEFTLRNIPLRSIAHACGEGNSKLEEFGNDPENDSCDSGACFT